MSHLPALSHVSPAPAGPAVLALVSSTQDCWGLFVALLPPQHACPQFPLCPGMVAQMIKRLRAMLETWVWSLGQEDPLEKEMATHSSTLAWTISWTEEPGRLLSLRGLKWLLQGRTSCSEAKLDSIWSQLSLELVFPLLAIAKGWEFSSQSVFCDNPNSHKLRSWHPVPSLHGK